MNNWLRRRASVPKDFGTTLQDHSPNGQDAQYGASIVQLSRTRIRDIVSEKCDVRRLVAIRTIRVFQILLGPILIAISARLLDRYTNLRDACNSDIHAEPCAVYNRAVGAFKYCVFPGIWSILQGTFGLRATFQKPLPLQSIIYILDGPAGGFHMGAGCTLAAMINGWDCEAGADADKRLCGHLYAAIAPFFLAVVATYTMIPLWCSLRAHQKRHE